MAWGGGGGEEGGRREESESETKASALYATTQRSRTQSKNRAVPQKCHCRRFDTSTFEPCQRLNALV